MKTVLAETEMRGGQNAWTARDSGYNFTNTEARSPGRRSAELWLPTAFCSQ